MDYHAFQTLSYGLYVISARHKDRIGAYIGNTVFQVTSEPPRLAISCHKDNHSAGLILGSGLFTVSVLRQDCDKELIGNFGYKSGKDFNKFSGYSFNEGMNGIPVLSEQCLAWLECRVIETVDAGTHLLFIADVLDAGLFEESGPPMTYAYYKEHHKAKAPKNAPTYLDESKLKKDEEEAGPATEPDRDLGPVYRCRLCGHEYDPAEGDEDSGIPPGTPFADLPDDWECPICGAAKEDYDPI